MSELSKSLSLTECTSKAGKARAESLSPERRAEIAKKAGLAKGTKGLPKATHGGILIIGDKEIECGVLPDKTRVISSVSVRNVLGLSMPAGKDRKRAKDKNLPTFLVSKALSPYLSDIFDEKSCSISYVSKSGQKTEGIKAEFLPKICEIYLKAGLDGVLSVQQIPTAKSCEIILSALAKVGVIALVDESSGFQEERARDELQTLLKKFINEDLLKWTQKFPHQFFREVYKIHGWKYEEGQCRHPHYLGQFINKYVYDTISPEVKKELQNKNPWIEDKGRREACHHQYLTPDVGIPALDKHLIQTIGLLRASRNKEEFKELFERVYQQDN